MALNEAGAAVRDVDFLHCNHFSKAHHFLRIRGQAFPDAPPVTTFACGDERTRTGPSVDFWWQGARCKATAAWTGVRIGKAMGFDEIVLCGCPMDTSGYFVRTHWDNEGTPRIGDDDRHPVVRQMRERFCDLAREEGNQVFSMSGLSRDILGPPP